MSFSKFQKGRGFWRLINKLLTDFDFIQGCNDVVKNTMLQYSGQLRLDIMTSEPTNVQYADASFDISNSLLHDVILLEVRPFVMKFEAAKKRKANERTSNLESEIDKLQDSQEEEDIK